MKIIKMEKPNQIEYALWNSPMGDILIAKSGDAVVRMILPAKNRKNLIKVLKEAFEGVNCVEDPSKLKNVIQELDAYFQGNRKTFTQTLAFLSGTPFQQSVWKALIEVPYGKTKTYGDIAKKVGRPKAFRAVGGANNANPIPIIIPCHRIIGSNGSLVGFGGGLDMKAKLLELERSVI